MRRPDGQTVALMLENGNKKALEATTWQNRVTIIGGHFFCFQGWDCSLGVVAYMLEAVLTSTDFGKRQKTQSSPKRH